MTDQGVIQGDAASLLRSRRALGRRVRRGLGRRGRKTLGPPRTPPDRRRSERSRGSGARGGGSRDGRGDGAPGRSREARRGPASGAGASARPRGERGDDWRSSVARSALRRRHRRERSAPMGRQAAASMRNARASSPARSASPSPRAGSGWRTNGRSTSAGPLRRLAPRRRRWRSRDVRRPIGHLSHRGARFAPEAITVCSSARPFPPITWFVCCGEGSLSCKMSGCSRFNRGATRVSVSPHARSVRTQTRGTTRFTPMSVPPAPSRRPHVTVQ